MACLLTAGARLHVRLAVGEVALHVLPALVAAHLADLQPGLERGTCRRKVEGGLAGEDPAGRQAHVGVIAAEADATDHRLPLRFP
jgi:hypothetical protein